MICLQQHKKIIFQKIYAIFFCILWLLLNQTANATVRNCYPSIISTMVAKTDDITILPPNEAWQNITLPDNLNQRGEDYNGGLWYRIKFRWDCPIANQSPEPAAIGIEYMSMAGAVFLNNTLLWQDKHLSEPLSRSWNTARYWILPSNDIKNKDNELRVYIVAVSGQTPGMGRVQIDLPQQIINHYDTSWWEKRGAIYVNIAVSVTIGIIALFIWLIQRKETAFGWFAASNILWSLFIVNALVQETFPFPNTHFLAKANLTFFGLYIICFILYNLRYMYLEYNKFEKAISCLLVVSLAILWLAPEPYFKDVLLTVFVFYTLAYMVCLFILPFIALKKAKSDNILLVLILIFYFIIAIHDAVVLADTKNTGTLWFSYTILVNITFFSFLLALRLSRNIQIIREFNVKLENKIHEVSKQLTASLKSEYQLSLENVKLQERLNLAHDLHDGLGGSLVRAITTIDKTKNEINKQQVLSMLKLMRDDLRQIIDSGSSIASEIAETPKLWIAPIRHRFVFIFDELHIESLWEVPDNWASIPTATQCMTLARVLEESLTNVIKHSKANLVKITLNYSQEHDLKLMVTDNGVGFDVGAVEKSGFNIGTRSMKARVERLKGSIETHSSPKGTTLIVTIPNNSMSL